MKTYHIPAQTVVGRQCRNGSSHWETFVTTRAVTYDDKDVCLNAPNYLRFWIPDTKYWLIQVPRKDLQIT